MELERKFLVKVLPDNLEICPTYQIKQGYLLTEPEIRIRKKTRIYDNMTDNYGIPSDYFLTVKGEGDESREENEWDITERTFDNLRSKIKGRLLTKTRYNIPAHNHVFELDLYRDSFSNTVEVEFNSVEEFDSFIIPAWFGEEITYDKRYKNKNLFKELSKGVI